MDRVGFVLSLLFLSNVSFAVWQENINCKVDDIGRDYRGRAFQTKHGKPCQAWAQDTPHVNNFKDPSKFPDKTLEHARNFCRNPNNAPEGPWCYLREAGDKTWGYCDIPKCGDFDHREHPWLVNLKGELYDKKIFGVKINKRKYYCGASVLNSQWLLTAGSCFEGESKKMVPKYWEARLARADLKPGAVKQALGHVKNWLSPVVHRPDWNEWDIDVEKIITYPHEDHSVAMVKLAKRIPSGSQFDLISAIKLINPREKKFPNENSECVVNGWSCNEEGELNKKAAEIDQKIASNDGCGRVAGNDITRKLCAGYRGDVVDRCSGFEGGPLICKKSPGRWYQVGILNLRPNDDVKDYNVYTRLTHYVNWIRQEMTRA